MAVKLSPFFNDAQIDSNGSPLAGGLVYWYAAGTTTPRTTYTSSSGSTAQANPVVLNSRGEPNSPIWLTTGLYYKAVLRDSAGVLIRTIDNISGINDVAQQAVSEWALMAGTGTWISTTTFSVTGDVTAILTASRRLKIALSSTFYGTIVSAGYGAGITTVEVIGDNGTDIGASSPGAMTVYYGILSSVNESVPALYLPLAQMTGMESWFYTATAPAGWLAENGDTIGADTSGADHEGEKYRALFDWLWANGTDTTCPMLTSGGGASTRGASAAADWAANKRLTLPNVAHGYTLISLTGTSGDLGTATAGDNKSHTHPIDVNGSVATDGTTDGYIVGTGGLTFSNPSGGSINAAAGQYRGLYIHI